MRFFFSPLCAPMTTQLCRYHVWRVEIYWQCTVCIKQSNKFHWNCESCVDVPSTSFHEQPYCSAAHVGGSYLNCGATVEMLKCLSHLTKALQKPYKRGKNTGEIRIPEDLIWWKRDFKSANVAVRFFGLKGIKFAASRRIKYKINGFKLKRKKGYEMDVEIKEKGAKEVTRIEY